MASFCNYNGVLGKEDHEMLSNQNISIWFIMMALSSGVGRCSGGVPNVRACVTCKLGVFKFHATFLNPKPTIFLFLYMNVEESFASMNFLSFQV
jgi:hypothetical protein